jgi:hypothetical protein
MAQEQKSETYKALRNALETKTAIYVTYRGDGVQRKLCPHVLGYKKEKRMSSDDETQANERVLCYQLEGPNPQKGWRCFNIIELKIVNPQPGPATGWETPPNYLEQKWQNSVKNPKDEYVET